MIASLGKRPLVQLGHGSPSSMCEKRRARSAAARSREGHPVRVKQRPGGDGHGEGLDTSRQSGGVGTGGDAHAQDSFVVAIVVGS